MKRKPNKPLKSWTETLIDAMKGTGGPPENIIISIHLSCQIHHNIYNDCVNIRLNDALTTFVFDRK